MVGCSMISRKYMDSIKAQFAVLEVVACTDLDVARMNQTAEEYGIKAMTYDEILADPEIEMVLNLTNPVAHYPITKAALEADKHVYSEKMIVVVGYTSLPVPTHYLPQLRQCHFIFN